MAVGAYRRPAYDPAVEEQISEADRAIIDAALPLTMTGDGAAAGADRRGALLRRRGVPGAFAECGVWRGGSVLAMILTLQELGVADRDIYLYDTFEGMTEPTEHDVSPLDPPALETWDEAERSGERPWSRALRPRDLQRGRACARLLLATGYPGRARCTSSAGPVEDTLPAHAPGPSSRCCGSTPTGTSRPATSWSTSTRGCRRRRPDHRRLRPLGGRAPGRRRVLRRHGGRCCSAGSTTRAGIAVKRPDDLGGRDAA